MGSEKDDVATTPERPSRPGTVFAPGELLAQRYCIVRFLAEGGMGEVYEARDTVLAERIALKTIRADIAAKPHALARFRREIHVARQVTHPNVCRVFDLGEHGATTFLTMQLLDGESLAALLKRKKRLDSGEALAIARQIAAAIDAAHAAGVIHRDLKPANVILVPARDGGEPRAVVTDFGLGRTIGGDDDHHVSNTGDVGGTPAYMAPEQVEGAGVGPAADIYAFGVMLFEMVTGTRPFKGESSISAAVKRLKHDAPSPRSIVPEIDVRWDAAILAALARDPSARPASAGAVIDLFASPGAAASVVATAVAPSTRTARPRRRRRPYALAALALVALGGAGLAYRWWARGRLPAGDRQLAIVAVNRGSKDDDWLARAVQRMATRWLERRELRFDAVADPAAANVVAHLAFQRVDTGVELELDVGPADGRATSVGRVSATSVADGLDQLLPELAERVGADRPERGPNEAERADMKLLGAPSFPAYRLYQQLVDESFSALLVENDALPQEAEKLVAIAPTWAHAWALLTLGYGIYKDPAFAVVARARRAIADPTADPIGGHLLDLVDLGRRNDYAAALAMLGPDFQRAPHDVLLGAELLFASYHAAGANDTISVARHLYDERPDLQFGSDLAGTLRHAGRSDEVSDLVESWLRTAPESEQALTAQIERELDGSSDAAAVGHTADLLLLHGRAPMRLVVATDMLIAADRTRDARPLADEAMRGNTLDRVRAEGRLATIAIMEGRFSAAIDALHDVHAIGAQPALANTEAAANALAEGISLADLLEGLGHAADAVEPYLAMEGFARSTGDLSSEVIFHFDSQLASGTCPVIAEALARIPAGRVRDDARRTMLRAAVERNCAACSDVLAEGLAPIEIDARPLFQFAACAEQEGQVVLALDSYARTRRVVSTAINDNAWDSPFFSILARYRHARLLERTGHPAEAKAEYDDFLAHWGHADRPLPEIDDARQAVARLSASK